MRDLVECIVCPVDRSGSLIPFSRLNAGLAEQILRLISTRRVVVKDD